LKLEVAVEDVSQCIKNLTIVVPAEEVRSEFNQVFDTYQRQIKLPGFRPGRVPRDLVKQRFGKEIKEEVAKHLAPHALQHAIQDNKLRIVAQPSIQEYTLSEGEPMKFTASIEVAPEFELQDYKGLKAVKRVASVREEDVDKTLENWRESAAQLVPVEDRPAQLGDILTVDLSGKYVEPAKEEDLKADGVDIELGAEGVHETFTEKLTGAQAGEKREFRVVYPEDFSSKGLAGNTIDFTAVISSVRQKELPALDDDFAKEYSDQETLGALRDRIRDEMSSKAEQRASADLRNTLLEQIVAAYDFEVPPSLVDQKAYERAQEFAYLLSRSGVPQEQIKGWDWDQYLEKERGRAVNDVRASLITAKISETENLSVSREEVDAEIARMADSTRESFAQLKARLTKDDALSSIESRMLFQKALDVIANSAEVTVQEIAPNEETEGAKADDDALDAQIESKTVEQP
jgi:trigger factor